MCTLIGMYLLWYSFDSKTLKSYRDVTVISVEYMYLASKGCKNYNLLLPFIKVKMPYLR